MINNSHMNKWTHALCMYIMYVHKYVRMLKHIKHYLHYACAHINVYVCIHKYTNILTRIKIFILEIVLNFLIAFTVAFFRKWHSTNCPVACQKVPSVFNWEVLWRASGEGLEAETWSPAQVVWQALPVGLQIDIIYSPIWAVSAVFMAASGYFLFPFFFLVVYYYFLIFHG